MLLRYAITAMVTEIWCEQCSSTIVCLTTLYIQYDLACTNTRSRYAASMPASSRARVPPIANARFANPRSTTSTLPCPAAAAMLQTATHCNVHHPCCDSIPSARPRRRCLRPQRRRRIFHVGRRGWLRRPRPLSPLSTAAAKSTARNLPGTWSLTMFRTTQHPRSAWAAATPRHQNNQLLPMPSPSAHHEPSCTYHRHFIHHRSP